MEWLSHIQPPCFWFRIEKKHVGGEAKRAPGTLTIVRPQLLLSLVGAAALLVVSAAPAGAYQCTPVTDAEGRPVSPPVSQVWNQRCIPYYINRGGTLFSGDARRQLLAQSFQVWDGNPCTDLDFVDLGYTNDTVEFDPRTRDNQNVIISIEDPAEIPKYFPDANMVAITITAFSTASGEIFDADIVVNGSDFDFVDVDDEAACRADSNPPFDLRAILIHEMGHFIGFDHESDTESTMFFSAPPCETKKRTLTDDDILGLCTVYASGQPPMTCAEPSIAYDDVEGASLFRDQCARQLDSGGGCTCAAQPRSRSAWWALGLLALGPWLRRRR